MRKLIPYIAILCIFLTGGAILYFFRVKDISVNGTKQLSGVENYSNNLIFFLKPSDIEKEILQNNPTLQKVHIELTYPSSLNIIVTEARPIAKVKLEDGFMAVSTEGKILSKQRDDILTISIPITYYQPIYFQGFAVGDLIDIKEVVDAVYFIEETQKLALPIGRVDIRNENMIVLISEEREILVSSTKDTREQVAQLKVVLEQFRTKAIEFNRLDVRFEKPIVVFKK